MLAIVVEVYDVFTVRFSDLDSFVQSWWIWRLLPPAEQYCSQHTPRCEIEQESSRSSHESLSSQSAKHLSQTIKPVLPKGSR
jgi:hypothetical protein